jgi:hypothetical protein
VACVQTGPKGLTARGGWGCPRPVVRARNTLPSTQPEAQEPRRSRATPPAPRAGQSEDSSSPKTHTTATSCCSCGE